MAPRHLFDFLDCGFKADGGQESVIGCEIVERIREDIIIPAKARGYRNIWMLGISMGGMGAIWYDRTHPGDVNGLILLSPYLGEKTIVETIEKAGGLSGAGGQEWTRSGRNGSRLSTR